MERRGSWIVGAGAALALCAASAGTASAQTRVDVGIFTPRIGARVVVGEPRVVVVPPPRVVVVDRYDDHPWDRAGSSKYWREREKAERKYYRDLDKARRKYEKNLRKAERHRW